MHRDRIDIHVRAWLLRERLAFLQLNNAFLKEVESIRTKHNLNLPLPIVDETLESDARELMKKYDIYCDQQVFTTWLQTSEVDEMMDPNPIVFEYGAEEIDLSHTVNEASPESVWLQVKSGTSNKDILKALDIVRKRFSWQPKDNRFRPSPNYKRDIEIYKMKQAGMSVTEINSRLKEKYNTKTFGREDINKIVSSVKKQAML